MTRPLAGDSEFDPVYSTAPLKQRRKARMRAKAGIQGMAIKRVAIALLLGFAYLPWLTIR